MNQLYKPTIYAILLLCNMIMCLSLSVITPFFPPYAISRGISEKVVGIIISANPLGAFFASIILGKILKESNRFFYMISGLILQGIGMFTFGGSYFIPNRIYFILISTLARVLSGMGASCFVTPFYAYIPIIYPDEVEKKIGISELVAGLGFFLGPILGSLLYYLGGYLLPFIVFGGITCVITPILYCLLNKFQKRQVLKSSTSEAQVPLTKPDAPKISLQEQQFDKMRLSGNNKSLPPVQEKSGEYYLSQCSDQKVHSSFDNIVMSRYSHEAIELGYLQVLKKYDICLTFCANIVINFVIMYFAPTLSQFLQESYNATPSNVGALMSVYSFTYTICSIFATNIKNNKPIYIFIGIIITGLAYFTMGPDKTYTGLNKHLYIVLISQGFIGIGVSLIFILAMPLMNEELYHQYPKEQLQCANISSALFNAGMSIGELIGPIVAGTLTQFFGFERGCVYTGIFILAFGLLYLPVCIKRKDKVEFKVSNVEQESVLLF